ncbi:HAD family hydrolase [Anaerococcus sp. AGMB00486]|uniref:HAD family hydrolase n=1 Tax=Anaerococcus faecalis TaxID=2742993 RepID=A0ABX2N7N9_9FIRM|nr:HAD hydrolase-like protein [Anaerococcus faecalis]NVF10706.1 HAD family hydrolase [Anaerococcus faecalis]
MILVFDFDETLHQSDEIYKRAFYKTLNDNNIKSPSLNPLLYLGDPPRKIWDEFLDNSYDKEKLMKETGNNMISLMPKYGKLFENTEDVLKILNKKYSIFICSSCTKAYINIAREIYNLDRYIESYLVGEDFSYKEKYQILYESINDDFIMIGDRLSDIMAGFKNNQISIFANYGYSKENEGELSDYKIEKIEDILKIKVLSL